MKKRSNSNNNHTNSNNTYELEKRYERLFETMGQGVIHHDETGVIINANPAACKLLGLTLDQMKGKTTFDPDWRATYIDGTFFPPELHPVMECINTSKQVRDVVMGIYQHQKKEHVWLLVNAEPVFNEPSSKPHQIITTFTDITSRVKLEHNLREQSQLQELLTKISRTFINANANSLNTIINQTLAELGNFIGIDRFYIFDYNLEKGTTSNTYEWCSEGTSSHIDELQEVPVEMFPEWLEKHEAGEAMIINDVLELEEGTHLRDILLQQSIKSMIALPLMDGDNAIGFIGIDAVKQNHNFSITEQSWLNVLADILVNVSHKINAENELKDANETLTERHKELSCVYKVLELNQLESLSIEVYCQKVVDLIPSGFVCNQEVSVRLNYNEQVFVSKNFNETTNKLEVKFLVDYNTWAVLQVYNPVKCTFLPEEIMLVESLKQNIELKFEKKLAKILLQESEEKYKIIANNTYHWEFWNGPDNKFIYHSPACQKIIGYTAEELLSNQDLYTNAIYPDDLDAFIKHHANISYQRGPEKHFFRIISKTGELKHIEHVCQPIFDNNNNFIGIRGTNIDITDRKKAEEEIYKFRIISDQAYYGTAITSIDGVLIYCNDSFAKMHGYEVSEIIGKNLMIFHNEEQMPLIEESINKIKVDGGFVDEEIPHCKKDGTVFPTLMSAKMITMNDGLSSFMSATIIDITEKKKADAEILKFRIIADQANYGVGIASMDGIIEYVNTSFAKMHGWEQKELIGKHVSVTYGIKENAEFILNEIKNKGGFFSKEVTRMRKDKTEFPALMNAMVIGDGKSVPKLMSVSIVDISERKKTEEEIIELNQNLEKRIQERTKELALANVDLVTQIETRKKIELDLIAKSNELESFFSVTIDLLCIATVEGKFIKLNKAWEATLGYHTSELENNSLLDYVHPEDINDTLNALKELSEQSPILKFINRYRTKRGDYRYIEWHSVPVGKYIYSAARDITERMNYEEDLRKAQVTAETANRSKSEFLSRMSHELRTPMNSILGFAQLLEMGDLNSSQQKGVAHILKSGKHLLNLINEVLDISKIEAGKISISSEPVEIKALINEIIEVFIPIANNRRIKINNLVNKLDTQFVKADKQRLKQVIINLVNNAIKYNHDEGSVWISLEYVMNNLGNIDDIKIIIKDNGMGIAEADLDRIFFPFERVGKQDHDIEGTGLGLAVVKQLIDLMGGTLGVESELGKGSSFWIKLPHCLSYSERVHKNGDLFKANEQKDGLHGSILYIEDNSSNIELVREIIETKTPNIKLFTNTNGKQAVSLAIQLMPSLILLDLHLPDIHGSEVLKELSANEKTKNIPVVVVSADAMSTQIENMYALGAKNYLTKPIDVATFLNVIGKYVN
jgi:PAS domain S-box-containing protein